MKLAVIIIHYNTSGDLDRCLESLASYPPSADHQIVVVDNASRDDGLEQVQRRFSDVTWIMNTENLGYAKGFNRGMATVQADYYLILNPDVVVQPGAMDRLLDFADAHPRAGIIGPQLLNDDGTIQASCRRFYTFKTLVLRRTFLGKIFPDSNTVQQHLMKDFDHRTSRPVDWVLGGCMLARRSALARTGPMDERFFLYFEDVDWCYRMWQAGYEVLYAPEPRFMHKHRRDSARNRFGRSFWMHLGSLLSFYEKWGMLVWLLKKWRDPLQVFLLWAVDMAAVGVAFVSAYGLRMAASSLFAEPLFPFSEYRPLLWFSLLLTTLTFLLTGRYRPRGWRRPRPLAEQGQQLGIVALLLLSITYLGHLEVVSRAVVILFLVLMGLLTWGGEALFRRGLKKLEKGNFSLERTLLTGPAEPIRNWLRDAGDLAAQGVDVAGYLSESGSGTNLPPLMGGTVPWLGRPEEIEEVVRRYRISQVVFWSRPGAGFGDPAQGWRALGALRRMRVRLRWHLDDVWLLATGSRAEVFGADVTAVQGPVAGRAVKTLVRRGASLAASVALFLLILPAWFRMKLVRGSDAPQVATVQVMDLWGHDPELKLTVDGTGRVLPLFWQTGLVRPLWTGHLGLWGPRPGTGVGIDVPETPRAMLSFWESDPRLPGLTGRWCCNVEDTNGPLWSAAVRQLWTDPCGLGRLNNFAITGQVGRDPSSALETPEPEAADGRTDDSGLGSQGKVS